MFGMDPILAGMCIGAGTMLILWIMVLATESREQRQRAADEREFVEESLHNNIELTRSIKGLGTSIRAAIARGKAHEYGAVIHDLGKIESDLAILVDKLEDRGVYVRTRWKEITQREAH